MKKFLFWLGAVAVVLAGAAYGSYRLVPTVTKMVDIQLMNMKEITQFEVQDDRLLMNGLINSKTHGQMAQILDDNPQITTLVEGQMEGSIDDDTMIKMAYMVRERGLNTMLLASSNINSGAVDLFLAGVERTMERGAHIGVHSWASGTREAMDFPRNAPEHENNRKYIEVMLGADDFYWFTIAAAPAENILEMSEAEIIKYNLLTQPIFTENLTLRKGEAPGVFRHNFSGYDISSPVDTVIVNLQGGPMTEFALEESFGLLAGVGGVDFSRVGFLNMHQEQTLKPWQFREPISFEQAKAYDAATVRNAANIITSLKSMGKTVYVVGISFGAFVALDLIATHGNTADGYLIMVGRLDMPATVWEPFAEGTYVGFEYGADGDYTVIPFSAEQAGMGGSSSVEDQNMARLAAGLGYKRFTELLQDVDLSNVVYAYGKADEQVGRLSAAEVAFLRDHGATVLESDSDHGGTLDEFTAKGLELLSVPLVSASNN